jgi:hypothetical protein
MSALARALCRRSKLWCRHRAIRESGVPVHFLSNVCFVCSVEGQLLTQWAKPNEQCIFLLRNEDFRSECPKVHSRAITRPSALGQPYQPPLFPSFGH